MLLIFADLDHLKEINDTYGHMAGDELLRVLGKIFNDVISPYGKAYRVGGDEFICVLLDISAETFNKLLSDCKMLVGTTASIGGVFVNNLEKGFDELLKKSDQSMYKEKELFYQNASR